MSEPQDTAMRFDWVTNETGKYHPHELARYTAEGAWIIHWWAIEKYSPGGTWLAVRKMADAFAQRRALVVVK